MISFFKLSSLIKHNSLLAGFISTRTIIIRPILMRLIKHLSFRSAPIYLLSIGLFATTNVFSAPPEFNIIIKDHLFIPSRIEIPENTKVKLIIHNHDETSEEFESYELNREKIVMGQHKAVIFIGPLKRGEYPFFGEFNPKLAQGVVVVVKKPPISKETD